jgi:Tfp pilus assembly protein PilF
MLATVYREDRPGDIPGLVAEAAELGSDDPVIQIFVGHRQLNEGNLAAARVSAARAGELVDDEFALTADLDRLVARIAARDGDDALAEAKFRSAVSGEPEIPTHPLDLARFLWARGRSEDAVAVLDESLPRVGARYRNDLEALRSRIVRGG